MVSVTVGQNKTDAKKSHKTTIRWIWSDLIKSGNAVFVQLKSIVGSMLCWKSIEDLLKYFWTTIKKLERYKLCLCLCTPGYLVTRTKQKKKYHSLTPINTSVVYSLSRAFNFSPEMTCSVVIRKTGSSHLCLWQHSGKEQQTNEQQDMTFGESWVLETVLLPRNECKQTTSDFGRCKGSSWTCWTNGALSGDFWQRQMCSSGAKLGVSKKS